MAIELLGGTVGAAADRLGVTYQAFQQWPADLSARTEDRVIASVARQFPSPEVARAIRALAAVKRAA